MSDSKTFYEQLQTMSAEELSNHYDTSSIVGRLMHMIGIGLIFAALVFSQTVWVVVIAIISVLCISRLAVGIDEIKVHIANLIETKYKVNS